MSNAVYPLAKEAFLLGDIVWDVDTIKVRLVEEADVYDENDQFLSDISALTAVGTDQTLANCTASLGVADADDTNFAALTGSEVNTIFIYKSTGVPGTSALIAYIDQGSNLPFTPNGSNHTITWHPSGIFRL